MDYFNYRNNTLYVENVPVEDIAEKHGTPCYIYSRATLERHYNVFDNALKDHPHQICYAVKANSNIAVLNILSKLGSGFDIVSVGELERVLIAGGDPKKIVFSGVGKLAHEIKRALDVGVGCFNIESESELNHLQSIAAEMNKTASIALRVNPNVNAKTHPYISTGLRENKFGVAIEKAPELYEKAKNLSHLNIKGVACHIGSQLTELSPLLEAFDKIIELADTLNKNGFNITHLDIGGGLGVPYKDETPPTPQEYADALLARINSKPYTLEMEPGRAIAANAGILVTRVEYLKRNEEKHFAIVDAAMNDLLRPTLYQAYHDIISITPHEDGEKSSYDIVGPVCETGDFIGKNRMLTLKEKDLLAIRTAGAYGFTMSSNYNTRPRAIEIMVDNDKIKVIRKREAIKDLFEHESIYWDNA